MVDHHGQLFGGEMLQVNGIPVGLLHWGTMVAPDHNAGVCLAEHLAGKGSAFEGDLVRVKLCEDLSANLVADGPLPEGGGFQSARLGETVVFDCIQCHGITGTGSCNRQRNNCRRF